MLVQGCELMFTVKLELPVGPKLVPVIVTTPPVAFCGVADVTVGGL